MSSQKPNQFRTAQLHNKNKINPLYTGDERTPVREGMLHLLSGHFIKRRLPASLSVEAAVALPLFVAAMLLLMYPMKIMSAQIEAQICMEHAGEIVSVSEGVIASTEYILSKNNTNPNLAGKTAKEAAKEAVSGAVASENNKIIGASLEKICRGVETIGTGVAIFAEFDSDTLGIPITTKLKMPDSLDPCTDIHVSCLVSYPFSGLLGNKSSAVRMVSRRRAWVGREGGAGRNYATESDNTGNTNQDDQQIVYVARNAANSGRYHTKATCHYISNTMTAVSAATVSSRRSSEGDKYHPCSSCKPGTSGTVYIFKSGNAYHASKDCKAIQSYAVEVTLKEAKERGLTVCTYCSRSH